MSNKARVLNHLQALSIPCEVYEHPAVFTMEECLALPYAAPDVTFCKNILLCNRQQTAFYLYVTLPDKPFRTADTSKLRHSSRHRNVCRRCWGWNQGACRRWDCGLTRRSGFSWSLTMM